MTDKELIQAFRCCEYASCANCPAHKKPECSHSITYGSAADRLETLAAENERLKAQAPQWVSVTERLPEANKRVIVERDGGKVEQGIFLGINGWWKVYGTNTKKVSHWMPMPEPPSTQPQREDI